MRSRNILSSLFLFPLAFTSTVLGQTTGTSSSSSSTRTGTSTSGSSSGACNNSPNLCSQQYNLITHLGAHNSPFVANQSNGYSSSANQYYSSTEQLDAGVRLLSAQIHYVSQTDSWHLCHSSCDLFDAGLLSTWLTSIREWLDTHPNDVVTLLLVNADNITPTQLASQYQSAGLVSYSYTPPFVGQASTQWPTLQSMIDDNTRLVTFVPNLNNVGSATYLLEEFTYIFENAYNVVQQAQGSCTSNFSCAVDRPTTVSSATNGIANGFMPMMNHLVYQNLGFGIQAPIPSCAATFNAPGSATGQLGGNANLCQNSWGRQPWVIFVDYFNIGPAIATVDRLNGITSPVGRSVVSDSIPNTNAAAMSGVGSLALWTVVAALGMILMLL